MSAPYSEDLRARAVAAVEAGMSRHKAAKRFSVGVSSVIRWCHLKAETGSVAAKAMGGKVKPKLLPERDWILARLEAEPSLAIEELRGELAQRGVKISHGALWAFLDRENLTFKKNSARRRTRAG